MQAHQFNDDDYYEYDPLTLKIVRSYGPRAFVYRVKPLILANGHVVVKGMRAKNLGLIR